MKTEHRDVKVLIFTGEILNEQLWVDALHAHCDGIILKSGELLTRDDVLSVMNGKKYVFNQPILKKIVDKFCDTIQQQMDHQEDLYATRLTNTTNAFCVIWRWDTQKTRFRNCVPCRLV